MGMSYFPVLVAMYMDGRPTDPRIPNRFPQGLHKVEILLPGVGQIVGVDGLKGTGVVAGNRNRASGHTMKRTQGIDQRDDSVQSCKLASM